MAIQNSEFESAFSAVQKTYPVINRTLARSFLHKLQEHVLRNRNRTVATQKKFPELLRLALNDCHIGPSDERHPYRVLAGKFFGRRGARVKNTKVRRHLHQNFKQRRLPELDVQEEPSGQFAWKI